VKEGTGSLLGWTRLFVRFDALASLSGDWVLGKIDLDGLHASIAIKPDGSLSISDLLAKLNTPPLKPAVPPNRVAQFAPEVLSSARPGWNLRTFRAPSPS